MSKEEYGMRDSFSLTTSKLVQRRGDYGFDAPYVPISLGIIGLIFLITGIVCLLLSPHLLTLGIISILYGLSFLLSTVSYVYTTRRGKFQCWAELLTHLELKGDEQLLDLGCGRGAVLLMAASLLPEGKATGIDLWKASDQSGNALQVTRHNAELEGVDGRVDLQTADMCDLPFDANSFDVVLSSLAIHNIPDARGRLKAIDEAVRVLKPGGKLLIADFRQTQPYPQRLQELGMTEIQHRMLGWRFWYGGPWTATKLVTARKPA